MGYRTLLSLHADSIFLSPQTRTNCWFSVSRHSKQIKKKIKMIRQIKSRIWERKGGKYTKTLTKIWVEGIIRIRDIRGNVLPKFIELCMETPCWSSSGRAPTRRMEINRNICYRTEFCYKSMNLLLEELINIKVKLFLILQLFRQQNSSKKVTFLT